MKSLWLVWVHTLTSQCASWYDLGWCWYANLQTNVVGVMERRNIAPKAGIETTSLAFRANVLTITPPRLPAVTTLPTPTCIYVYELLNGPLQTITQANHWYPLFSDLFACCFTPYQHLTSYQDVLTCDSAHSWRIYSAASLGHHDLHPTHSHYPVTDPISPCPILIMLSTRLGSNKYQF